ncbi:hypothetical protein BZA05DRAFT_438471 [Tricharina praecox]|uniref:uncharacterized protein n=1 Tax=Tricharina praecox TaxID=43433 RepID=UPI00221FB730|nr:uncharacterized protein BZA05DRAFT_438471 [Tricharina praecox]KAI5845984.1 hypothetical protein BZA05DRAFT_438471 [Tricharina praecox]
MSLVSGLWSVSGLSLVHLPIAPPYRLCAHYGVHDSTGSSTGVMCEISHYQRPPAAARNILLLAHGLLLLLEVVVVEAAIVVVCVGRTSALSSYSIDLGDGPLVAALVSWFVGTNLWCCLPLKLLGASSSRRKKLSASASS